MYMCHFQSPSSSHPTPWNQDMEFIREIYFDWEKDELSHPLSDSSVEWIALGNDQLPDSGAIWLESK